MKRLIVLAVLVISAMLFADSAFAHTKLTASVPKENAVADSPVTEIVLDFNTEIEPVSRITLTNEGGQEVPVADVQVSGARMTGKLAEPLPNGSYTVSWKIIGADGHAVNGSYAFTVNVPAADNASSAAPAESSAHAGHHAGHAPSASAGPPAASAQPESSPEQEAAPTAAVAAAAQTGSDAESGTGAKAANTGVYWLAAAAVLVLVVIAVSLRMRRKRS